MLQSGDRLPPISLPRLEGGGTVTWRRQGRDPIVVVLLAAEHKESAEGYLTTLAAANADFELWGGRVLVVVPGVAMESRSITAGSRPLPILLDEPEGLRRRCAVPPGESAVFVADRFGEIFHGQSADSATALPGPDTIREWLKYLATQCAECGVPDESGYGEWS